MKLTIEISQLDTGDIAVHVKREAGLSTMRELDYAEVITQSITEHLKNALPEIAKQCGAEKVTRMNNPGNS